MFGGWGGFFACPSSRADSADSLFVADAAELREETHPEPPLAILNTAGNLRRWSAGVL
jgi:hypothetical protein